MSKNEPTPLERWAAELDACGKKLQSQAKAILNDADNPFATRENADRVDKTLSETDLSRMKCPSELRKSFEAACIASSAEFWQGFCVAVRDLGWDIHGTTERRLVARAMFVELKNDAVTIDGVPGKLFPHVPSVVAQLKSYLTRVALDGRALRDFVNVVAQAYDALGGSGEIAIESVFRQCVLLVQPATFWASIEPAKFQPLSRAAFRCRLSAILADNITSDDGRELRLTPTVNRKDVWELFSPAEGRVVQVGRLAFLRK